MGVCRVLDRGHSANLPRNHPNPAPGRTHTHTLKLNTQLRACARPHQPPAPPAHTRRRRWSHAPPPAQTAGRPRRPPTPAPGAACPHHTTVEARRRAPRPLPSSPALRTPGGQSPSASLSPMVTRPLPPLLQRRQLVVLWPSHLSLSPFHSR